MAEGVGTWRMLRVSSSVACGALLECIARQGSGITVYLSM
jgi:hypothetical protein